MGKDFFKYLPSEITVDILLRLPARTIMSCKCVCRPWLDLLTTREFVNSHLSKSVPCLAIFKRTLDSNQCKIAEFVNELDLTCDEHRWNIVYNFDFPFRGRVLSSANGLIFQERESDLFICNPHTREYLMLLPPPQPSPRCRVQTRIYGFGVSRMSGHYKVVRIFLEGPNYEFGCHVYTIGTGLWRRIACGFPYMSCFTGVFLNGNLHWLEVEECRICYLDLDTELFSSFSIHDDNPYTLGALSVLGDCLCVCESSLDESTSYCNIDIWLMKEYGDEESWTKEFIINVKVDIDDYSIDDLCELRPIKVFKDGAILMEWGRRTALYYSSKTQTIQEVDLFKSDLDISCSAARYFTTSMHLTTPSFRPLKTFAMENVSSF